MKSTLLLCALLLSPSVFAQDRFAQDRALIEEAFRLGGVRDTLDSLPLLANELTVAVIAQFPAEQRKQFTPTIKDAGRKFLDPRAFYPAVERYFLKHYDEQKLQTFIALERTSIYRTMYRLEAAANTAAGIAARHRFEANLQADPPPPTRITAMQKLDEMTGETTLQVYLVTAIVNSISVAQAATIPSDPNNQSVAFNSRIRPVMADQTLHRNLFIYRNADDAELEDYAQATKQTAVEWFNRNLQAAILFVIAERANQAGDAIKTETNKPFN